MIVINKFVRLENVNNGLGVLCVHVLCRVQIAYDIAV